MWITKMIQWLAKWLSKRPVFYIGQSDSLPTPLSRDKEIELLMKIKEGDGAARDTLIEHNLRLVVYIAKRFDNTKTTMEDLISIGSIGLIKAVETFNLDKNIKLATYASRCIENEILMHLRKTNKQKTEVSFDEPLNADADGNELLLSDILGTSEEIVVEDVERKMNQQQIHLAIKDLTDREKYIMECRYGLSGGDEMTQKEVADHLGISQSYISRLEKKIIYRLQTVLKVSG